VLQDSKFFRNRAARKPFRRSKQGTSTMKLYRIDKLAKQGGAVIKKKHILAPTDRQAVEEAEQSDDCPICDVLRDGRMVGQVL
jgi:hypothetical protein